MLNPGTKIRKHVYTCYICSRISSLYYTFDFHIPPPPPSCLVKCHHVKNNPVFFPPKSHRLSIESCENLQHMKEAVKWSSNRSKCWLQSLFLIQDFQILGFIVKKNDINCTKHSDFSFLN